VPYSKPNPVRNLRLILHVIEILGLVYWWDIDIRQLRVGDRVTFERNASQKKPGSFEAKNIKPHSTEEVEGRQMNGSRPSPRRRGYSRSPRRRRRDRSYDRYDDRRGRRRRSPSYDDRRRPSYSRSRSYDRRRYWTFHLSFIMHQLFEFLFEVLYKSLIL